MITLSKKTPKNQQSGAIQSLEQAKILSPFFFYFLKESTAQPFQPF